MASGFRKVRTFAGVTEYTLLKNGLRVLHKEDRSAPVALVMVVYHIGSRNEAVGHTGSTHILEHLLFKDSKHFNKKNGKSPTGYLEELGAYLNATTWYDRTNYFELIRKEHLREALALEADRMRGSLFSEQDLATEMTVVRNEYERSRNDPLELLDEALWAATFQAHPYHHPVIGWKDDIENSTVARLRDFYDRFYHPNNATLLVFGDVSAGRALGLVRATFGKLQRSAHEIVQPHTGEFPQHGRRFVEIRSPQDLTIVGIAHRIAPALHEDTPALQVLGRVVAGGLSSRLQHKLVDSGLASELTLLDTPLHDEGVFALYAYLTQMTSPEKVTQLVRREYAELASKGPSSSEVHRAKEQIAAELAYGKDGVYKEGTEACHGVSVGDWTFTYRFSEAVQAVTTADVMRVAERYLAPHTETLGYFLPQGKP